MRFENPLGYGFRLAAMVMWVGTCAAARANAPQIPAWTTWVEYGTTPRDHANYTRLKSELGASFQRFAMGNANQWWLVAGTYTYRDAEGKAQFLKFHAVTANDTQVPLHRDLMQVAFVEDTGQEAPRRDGLVVLLDYHWFYLRAKTKPAPWADLVREFVDSRSGKTVRNLLVDELQFSKNTLLGRSPGLGEFRFISPYN